jgi:VWFA-related protein
MVEFVIAAALGASLGQETRPLEFPAAVELIRLDVSVVDHKGKVVAGLVPSDFAVSEDGRPMEITYFQAVEPDGTLVVDPTTGSVRWQRHSDGAPRRIVVLVDTGPLSHAQLLRARRAVSGFLAEGTSRGDRIHLINLSTGRSWGGLIPDDRARLLSAARTLDRRASWWDGPGGREPFSERSESGPIADAPSEASTSGRFLSLFSRSSGLLGNLEALMIELSGVEGRKALVLVSPGFPNQRALETRLKRVASLARESATAVYFLDASGLDGLTPTPGEALVPVFDTLWQRSGGAQDLAEATGGFTFRLGNSLAPALGRVGSEMRTYYVLGYVPPRSADGGFREVQVRIDVPGLKARTKQGYVAGRSQR